MKKRGKFTYVGLNLLALALVGGLLLVRQFHLSAGWEHSLQAGVILVGFGLITWWVETHHATFEGSTNLDEAGQPLTPVQAHYRQIIRWGAKRKLW